jgi:hypothetical protein
MFLIVVKKLYLPAKNSGWVLGQAGKSGERVNEKEMMCFGLSFQL